MLSDEVIRQYLHEQDQIVDQCFKHNGKVVDIEALLKAQEAATRQERIDAGYVKLKSAEAIREWLSMLVSPYCHTAKYAQELYDWLKEERDE